MAPDDKPSAAARRPTKQASTAGKPPLFVTDLHENDVLLGRGAPIINYEGNVRFRHLVRTRKLEYLSTGRHKDKDMIARQIMLQITDRGGRFLKKVSTTAESKRLGVPQGETAWIVAGRDVAIEKVKQALRDKEPLRPNVARSVQAAMADLNASRQQEDLRVPPAVASATLHTGLAATTGGTQPPISLPIPQSMSAVQNTGELARLLQLQQQQELTRQRLFLLNQYRPQGQQQFSSLPQFPPSYGHAASLPLGGGVQYSPALLSQQEANLRAAHSAPAAASNTLGLAALQSPEQLEHGMNILRNQGRLPNPALSMMAVAPPMFPLDPRLSSLLMGQQPAAFPSSTLSMGIMPGVLQAQTAGAAAALTDPTALLFSTAESKDESKATGEEPSSSAKDESVDRKT